MTQNRLCFPAMLLAGLLALGLATGPRTAAAQDAEAATAEARYDRAEALRIGDGAAPDLESARRIHAALVAEGYAPSLVRLGAIHEELGQPDEAISAYERAIEETDSDYARLRLAQAHATGALGDGSRPEWGFEQLQELSRTADTLLADYALARAYEEGSGTPVDLDAALALYETLADRGYPLAQGRLGALYAAGRGVPQDGVRAVAYYRAAAEGGYDWALIGLARTEVALGRGAAALETIERAVARGVAQAEARRAIWHFDGAFGAASDPAFGRRELVRLAEAGDVVAARDAIVRHERRSRRLKELDLDAVIAGLERAMEGGDSLATITLARAYRELSWLIPDARARHAALVEAYGRQLGPRYEMPERLEALYDRNRHAESRRRTYDALARSEGQAFARGLQRLRSIDEMAFVYVLQNELAALGYGPCAASGRLTSCTLNAVLAFCSDAGIRETCNHGPLTYPASLEISRALERARADS
jgi:TPR repeat protein